MIPIRDHNPSRRIPFVTYALIALNVLIFLTYGFSGAPAAEAVFRDWALFPVAITNGERYVGLLSSMFLHAGFMHIAGNMLFLYIFGDNLEDHFGHVGFLIFYLASGLAASALHIAADPSSPIPTVGASGAIAGVLGGYLLLFPKARVDILLIIIVYVQIFTAPAYIVLAVWFGLQILGGVASIGETGGGVAYWAHAGGFVAGAAFVGAAWLAGKAPNRIDGHPDHPPTAAPTRVPIVRRSR